MAGRSIGDASLQLAEDYAQALRELEARSEAATTDALRRSLRGVMADLRRAYGRYAIAAQPDGRDPQGRPLQRGGAAVIRESADRFRSILEIAQDFLSDGEISNWQQRYEVDLERAQTLGGELSQGIAELVSPDGALPFGGANGPAIAAAARNAGAYLAAEGARFREQIVQITAEAAARGWGPKRMEDQVQRALEGAGDPTGKTARLGLRQRAALIARSELANAYVQGNLEHTRRQGFDYVRWIAVKDERLCPYCASRHGQIYPASKVVMPSHPRCVLADTPVSPGPVIAAYRSWYCGNVVTVGLADGSRITVTGNHPMLTSRGVRAAELLRQGDQLVGYSGEIKSTTSAGVVPDLNEVPARAEDVFAALSETNAVTAVSMPVSPLHLHGDGAFIEGEIDVVRAAGFLQGYWDLATEQKAGEGNGLRRSVRFAPFSAFSHAEAAVYGLGAAACGCVGRMSEAFALLRGGLSHAEQHRIATAAWLDPELTEPLEDGSAAYAKALRQCLDAEPGLVELQDVVNVEVKSTRCHVYTFETASGFYAVGDRTRIVTQNCRCVASPVPREVVELEAGTERDGLLDQAFWQSSKDEAVKEYAAGKGISQEKAARELRRYVKVPTATERRRYPGALESLMPSVTLES